MTLSRRRFLTISAAAAVSTPSHAATLHQMHFQALGADCQITLPGSRSAAEHAIADIQADLETVERAFSLYRPASQLSRLNRDGYLADLDETFRSGLALARDLYALTGRVFDPTVQSIWQANANGTRPGPVGMDKLVQDQSGIRFTQANMSATFNGIAQGIATDRAIAILKARGYRNVLANLGEFSGLGTRPEGRNWQIGVENPVTNAIAAVLSPTPDAPAIATSEPFGTSIAGRSHIFDPLDRAGPRWASVTVQAASASLADGLSTAIAAAPTRQAEELLAKSGVSKAILIDAKGSPMRLEAEPPTGPAGAKR